MINKLLSSITASGIAYVILQSRLHSDDALFLVTSSSYVLNLGLGLVAALAVYLSFVKRFKYLRLYIANLGLAVLMGLLGFAGFAYSGIDYHFGIIKPLDYVIMMQLGILFSIYALSYKHQPVNWRADKLKLYYLRAKQAVSKPLPKPAMAISQTRKPRHA